MKEKVNKQNMSHLNIADEFDQVMEKHTSISIKIKDIYTGVKNKSVELYNLEFNKTAHTREEEIKFINEVIKRVNNPLNGLIFNTRKSNKLCCIDGCKRLSVLFDFIENRISGISPKRGEEFYFSSGKKILSGSDRSSFLEKSVEFIIYKNLLPDQERKIRESENIEINYRTIYQKLLETNNSLIKYGKDYYGRIRKELKIFLGNTEEDMIFNICRIYKLFKEDKILPATDREILCFFEKETIDEDIYIIVKTFILSLRKITRAIKFSKSKVQGPKGPTKPTSRDVLCNFVLYYKIHLKEIKEYEINTFHLLNVFIELHKFYVDNTLINIKDPFHRVYMKMIEM